MTWSPQYIDDAALKSYLRIPEGDELDDAELAFAIEGASRAVDDCCHRQFGKVDAPEARFYTPFWSRRLRRYVVDIDDLMTTTSMLVALDSAADGTYSTSVAAADCQLLPLNAFQKGEPWTQIALPVDTSTSVAEGSVRITATWGWTTVPGAIEQATLIQAGRLAKRRDAHFGVAGSPEMGSEIRLLAKLDPDVAVTLRPYRRMFWGA